MSRAAIIPKAAHPLPGSWVVGRVCLHLVGAAAERGVSHERLWPLLGTTFEQAADPASKVRLSGLFAAWSEVMRVVREPGFPLEVARRIRFEDLHLLGFAVMSSASVADSLQRVERHARLAGFPAAWRREETREAALDALDVALARRSYRERTLSTLTSRGRAGKTA